MPPKTAEIVEKLTGTKWPEVLAARTSLIRRALATGDATGAETSQLKDTLEALQDASTTAAQVLANESACRDHPYIKKKTEISKLIAHAEGKSIADAQEELAAAADLGKLSPDDVIASMFAVFGTEEASKYYVAMLKRPAAERVVLHNFFVAAQGEKEGRVDEDYWHLHGECIRRLPYPLFPMLAKDHAVASAVRVFEKLNAGLLDACREWLLSSGAVSGAGTTAGPATFAPPPHTYRAGTTDVVGGEYHLKIMNEAGVQIGISDATEIQQYVLSLEKQMQNMQRQVRAMRNAGDGGGGGNRGGRGTWRGGGGGGGVGRGGSNGRGRGSDWHQLAYQNRLCYKCGDSNHLARDCVSGGEASDQNTNTPASAKNE